MKSENQIKQLANDIRIKPDAVVDERVLAFAEAILAKSTKNQDVIQLRRLSIRRKTMKSPITKLVTAAIVVIACVIGLSMWKSTESGVALADVLTSIDQVTGYMYQMSSTKTTEQGNSTNSTSTVLFSREHGVKTITKYIDPNTSKIIRQDKYWLVGQKPVTLIIVDHNKKTHLSMNYEVGVSEKRVGEEYDDPRTIIKQFLNCDHSSLGQSVVYGVTVEGFQTTDPAYNYEGGFGGQTRLFVAIPEKVDVKIWVDVKTFLPVRVEEEIVTKAGTLNHHVNYDFRWNVLVNASDFEPDIPSDYTNPTGDISFPAITEETAIKGLRLFAELAKHYPANPSTNKWKFDEQVGKLMGYNSWKNLSDDEKTKRNNDVLAPMTAFNWFYCDLVRNKKNPAYYGETVEPGDADKVLLRWRLDEGQYRVIFGDLMAKTVTAEELDKLEKHSSM